MSLLCVSLRTLVPRSLRLTSGPRKDSCIAEIFCSFTGYDMCLNQSGSLSSSRYITLLDPSPHVWVQDVKELNLLTKSLSCVCEGSIATKADLALSECNGMRWMAQSSLATGTALPVSKTSAKSAQHQTNS